jgi:hypothetical protein
MLSQIIFLYMLSHANYDGWFAYTGLHSKKNVAVVRKCEFVERFEKEKFEQFCQSAGKLLRKTNKTWFCSRTGRSSKINCEKILYQNLQQKDRVIQWSIE